MAEARRLAAQAEDQKTTWDRSVVLQAAQVHAFLGQALTAEKMLLLMARLAVSLDEPAAEARDDG
jgi:hypothetical protein